MCKGCWEERAHQWVTYRMSNDFVFYVSQSSKSLITCLKKNLCFFVLTNLRYIWSRSSVLGRSEIHYHGKKRLRSFGLKPGQWFQNKARICADFLLPYILPAVAPQSTVFAWVFPPLSKVSVVKFPAEGTNPRAPRELPEQIKPPFSTHSCLWPWHTLNTQVKCQRENRSWKCFNLQGSNTISGDRRWYSFLFWFFSG